MSSDSRMIDSRVTEPEGRLSVEAGTPNQETVAGIPHTRGQIMSSYPFATKVSTNVNSDVEAHSTKSSNKMHIVKFHLHKSPIKARNSGVELESGKCTSEIRPGRGRLKFFLQNWEILTKGQRNLTNGQGSENKLDENSGSNKGTQLFQVRENQKSRKETRRFRNYSKRKRYKKWVH